MTMNGFKTFSAAGIALITSILLKYGIQVDASTLNDLLMVGYPILMAIMRCFTRTPIITAKT